MRSRFMPEAPDPEVFIRTAVIVPDANVLLGLYRLSPQARDDALAALETVAERLRLPHQVGVEFYRNLTRVRGDLGRVYSVARKAIEDARKAPTAFGEGRRYESTREAVRELVENAIDGLVAELDSLRLSDPTLVDPVTDVLLTRLERIFDDRTLPEPTYGATQSRVEHFTTYRLPNKIPPGYEDGRDKPEPIRAAGDYLIWCEVLDAASEDLRPFLVLTDDTKSDWYVRVDGKTEGPHPHLVREFADHSSHGYHQMTLARFVDLARELLGADVTDASVEEIETAAAESALEGAVEQALLQRLVRNQLAHGRTDFAWSAGVPDELRSPSTLGDLVKWMNATGLAPIDDSIDEPPDTGPAEVEEPDEGGGPRSPA